MTLTTLEVADHHLFRKFFTSTCFVLRSQPHSPKRKQPWATRSDRRLKGTYRVKFFGYLWNVSQ